MIVTQAETNGREISRLREALGDTLAVVEHLMRTTVGDRAGEMGENAGRHLGVEC
jgi:hypothetical protein